MSNFVILARVCLNATLIALLLKSCDSVTCATPQNLGYVDILNIWPSSRRLGCSDVQFVSSVGTFAEERRISAAVCRGQG